MLPLQPAMNPLDDGFRRGPLRALRSTNRTDAAGWPALGALAGAGGDALRALERAPPALLPAEFGARASLFVQLQGVAAGAAVTAHVDPPGVGGAAIATAVVAGASEVRVGGVRFVVRPGDMYCLAGAARRDVDHEVYAHADDRLSVTFRYGPWDEPHHEAARGDAATDR